MRRLLFAVCVCFWFPAGFALGQAQPTEIPKIILSGFDSFKSAGADEAVRVWLRNSPLDSNQESYVGVLHSTISSFGLYRAWEPITVRSISPSVRIVYLTLDFDRGPLFAKFEMYRSDGGWIVTGLILNVNETQVLPLEQQ
jgi:hypothetical protein